MRFVVLLCVCVVAVAVVVVGLSVAMPERGARGRVRVRESWPHAQPRPAVVLVAAFAGDRPTRHHHRKPTRTGG